MHGLSHLINKSRKQCWANQTLKAVPLSNIRNITIVSVTVLFLSQEPNIEHKVYICTKHCDKIIIQN
jgi:hypothetical protein